MWLQAARAGTQDSRDGDCDECFPHLVANFPGDVNFGRFRLSVAHDLDDLALGEVHADSADIDFEVGDALVFDPDLAAERFFHFGEISPTAKLEIAVLVPVRWLWSG